MALAVDIDEVSKRFRIYHTHYSGLKDRILNFGGRNYETFWALKDLSLQVPQGQTLGLIGANGQGKSTLLQLIAGIIRPTKGQITTRGRVAILLELGAGFHPDLTGRENIYLYGSVLGLKKNDIDRHFDEIVDFAEIERFIDNQIKHYSSGMYVRLGFSIAVHSDPDIFLIDEVLAVGDETFQHKCLSKISQFQREGRSIVFVSHELDLVEQVCDRVLALDHGRAAAEGRPKDVVQFYRSMTQSPAG